MDYRSIIERLKAIKLARWGLPKDMLSQIDETILQEGAPAAKSKVIRLIVQLSRAFSQQIEKPHIKEFLDLFRDLIPGILNRALENYSAKANVEDFSLIITIFYLCQTLRVKIVSFFNKLSQECDEKKGTIISIFDLLEIYFSEQQNEKVTLILIGLLKLITILSCEQFKEAIYKSSCHKLLILADKYSMAKGSSLPLLETTLLKYLSYKALNYTSQYIEQTIGSLDMKVLYSNLFEPHLEIGILVSAPIPLSHIMEPVARKDIWIKNEDFIEERPNLNEAIKTELVMIKPIKRIFKSLLTLLKYDNSKPIFLQGSQGSGKTLLIEALAAKSNTQLIQIYMDESVDVKSLIGSFICSTESFGEFAFQKGPLTRAAELGMWVILENIDKANDDIIPVLLTLIERGEIELPTREQKAKVQPGFRLFFTTQLLEAELKSKTGKNIISVIGERYCNKANMPEYEMSEYEEILSALGFNGIYKCKELFRCVYESFALIKNALFLESKKVIRNYTFHDLKKLSKRIQSQVKEFYPNGLSNELGYLVEEFRIACVLEIYCCLAALLESEADKKCILNKICEKTIWNLDPLICERRIFSSVPSLKILPEIHGLSIGRCKNFHFIKSAVSPSTIPSFSFAYTSYSLKHTEAIAQALQHSEPILLVGPTGVGKTLIVQQIAKLMEINLTIYNMNCMSDATDLVGGYKPIAPKYLLLPFLNNFISLFLSFVSKANNEQFLSTLSSVFNKCEYQKLFKCIESALKSLNEKYVGNDKIKSFLTETAIMKNKILQMETQFAYQFIEGALISSLQNGSWVLLDELNLATDETLQKLAPIIEGRSITVTDRSDLLPVKRHENFRLICCMNPGGTVGKKQLPQHIRSRFTEIYMNDMEEESDILFLVGKILEGVGGMQNENLIKGVAKFYLELRDASKACLLQTASGNKRPTFSIRNLCRAMEFIKAAYLDYGMQKAIFDGITTCLLSQLNAASKELCIKMLVKIFPNIITHKQDTVAFKANHEVMFGYNLPCNTRSIKDDPDKTFVITRTFTDTLSYLCKIIANTQLPILLEGHTSSGKTSMIEYLAAKTKNYCIRINNHLNTDIQEYIGGYIPDEKGKLYFQEGALIEAVRKGYWVILDELNLAPSEVLEALNRLLDENREIFIAETQTMVKAHPMFRIFATQNPTEGYGGRKELSEAFRNRFIIIYVPEIPLDELQTVVEKRCGIAPSHAKKMIQIMQDLQINRRESDILSGKQSFITVRDLIKWATRPIITYEDIAYAGYTLLGERLRSKKEKELVKEIIEKHCKVKLNLTSYYTNYCDQKDIIEKMRQLNAVLESGKSSGGLTKISWNNSMKRLFTLVDKCAKNKEPVLLVGETGCGKTTVCQILSMFENSPMYTISCHQGTEASDFIGGLRTVKTKKLKSDVLKACKELIAEIKEEKKQSMEIEEESETLTEMEKHLIKALNLEFVASNEALKARFEQNLQDIIDLKNEKLFEWENGPLIKAMIEGGILLIDEISLTDDSVIERINSVLEKDRILVLSEKSAQHVEKYEAHSKFLIFATMNPGGDYGKKELSPALRNRFTEIWVDSLLWNEDNSKDDLYQVIQEKLTGDRDTVERIAKILLEFVCWYNEKYIKEMNIERKALSLRDILGIIDFINHSRAKQIATYKAYREAVNLFVFDGLCTNIDVSGDSSNKIKMEAAFNEYVTNQLKSLAIIEENKSLKTEESFESIQNSDTQFGIFPYFVTKIPSESQTEVSSYCLTAPTPTKNMIRLLRAMSLNKPILLEGNPGVGKSSLVECLGKYTNHKVINITLSEHTDMMDLLGCEYPATNEYSISKKPEFKWADGILLQAIKSGSWVLIDELNLASQSVLEGLNGILDHRKMIFIPELGKEYQCHPDFRFFAAQSPARQGASRKNLPKSFLNRFIKIYLEPLIVEDLLKIAYSLAGKSNESIIQKIVEFNEKCRIMKSDGKITGVMEYNMRDVKRIIEAIKSGADVAESMTMLYLSGLRSKEEKRKVKEVFQTIFSFNMKNAQASKHIIYQNEDHLNLTKENHMDYSSGIPLVYLSKQKKYLKQLMKCVELNLPVTLTGPEASGKSLLIKKLAELTNNKLLELIVGSSTDSSELLGCYEQTNMSTIFLKIQYRLNNTYTQLLRDISKSTKGFSNMEIWAKAVKCSLACQNSTTSGVNSNSDTLERLKEYALALKAVAEKISTTQASTEISHLSLELAYISQLNSLIKANEKIVGRFEWIDSQLVTAIKSGYWVIIKNANMCNPSVLDRINPVLDEETREQGIIVNEAGGENLQIIKCHKNFRIFFIYDHQYGELSRSLRNRCVEIAIKGIDIGIEVCDLQPSNEVYAKSTASQRGINAIDLLNKEKSIVVASENVCIKLGGVDKETKIETIHDLIELLKCHKISDITLSSAMILAHICLNSKKNQKLNLKQLLNWALLFNKISETSSQLLKNLINSCVIIHMNSFQNSGKAKERVKMLCKELLASGSTPVIQQINFSTPKQYITPHTGQLWVVCNDHFNTRGLIKDTDFPMVLNGERLKNMFLVLVKQLLYEIKELNMQNKNTLKKLEETKKKGNSEEVGKNGKRPQMEAVETCLPGNSAHILFEIIREMTTKGIITESESLKSLKQLMYTILPYLNMILQQEHRNNVEAFSELKEIISHKYQILLYPNGVPLSASLLHDLLLISSLKLIYSKSKSNLANGQNIYFTKLMKYRQRFVSQLACINDEFRYFYDFAIIYSAISKSHSLVFDLIPCLNKLFKLAKKCSTDSNLEQLILKLKNLYSKLLQIASVPAALPNPQPLILSLSKYFELPTLLPKSEELYREYISFRKLMSPYLESILRGYEVSANGAMSVARIHFSEDIKKEVLEILCQQIPESFADEASKEITSKLRSSITKLNSHYQSLTASQSSSSFVINLAQNIDYENSDKEDEEEAGCDSALARIGLTEKKEDILMLKYCNCIPFSMLIKDLVAIKESLQEGNAEIMTQQLLHRYSKRNTLILVDCLQLASSSEVNSSLFRISLLLINKLLVKEYYKIAMKPKSTNFDILDSIYYGMTTYFYKDFSKNISLFELSFKMDYLLKIREGLIKYSIQGRNEKGQVRIEKTTKQVLLILQRSISVEESSFKELISQVLAISQEKDSILSFCKFYSSISERGGSIIKELNSKMNYLNLTSELTNVLSGGETKNYYSINQSIPLYLISTLITFLGHPALDMLKQLKIPAYIAYYRSKLNHLYQELITKTWVKETLAQLNNSNDTSLSLLPENISKANLSFKKYSRQYRYRDITQFNSMMSLVDSLANITHHHELFLNSIKALMEQGTGDIAMSELARANSELIVAESNIKQTLIKLLMNYLSCNVDILVIYLIGVYSMMKALRKIRKEVLIRLNKTNYCMKLYHSITPNENLASESKHKTLSFYHMNMLKSTMELWKNNALTKFLTNHTNNMALFIVKLARTILHEEDESTKREQKEPEYKFHGKSLSDKILEEHKAIDEMTKKENMEKKQKELQESIDSEFPDYKKNSEDLFSKKAKLPEANYKVNYTKLLHLIIRQVISEFTAENGSINLYMPIKKFLGKCLKSELQANYSTKSQSLLSSCMLLQETIDILSQKVTDLNENIGPPKWNQWYHFYKDPNPSEIKLVHNPIMSLLSRIKALLRDYPDNLILVNCAQICDKVLSFDIWKTPVAKIMAGLEMIIDKAHEWQSLASKKLNSLDKELKLIYQVVIRFRKMQLICWKELFKAKIKEIEESPTETSFMCLLLSEFSKSAIETSESIAPQALCELYKTIDKYLLQATMATFPYRLKIIKVLQIIAHKLKLKQEIQAMLNYVVNYYGIYLFEHNSRFEVLAKPMKDKLSELVKIAKWDINNYYQFQSCITHNHIQLIRIIKDYNSILNIPFQTSVRAHYMENQVLNEAFVFYKCKSEIEQNNKAYNKSTLFSHYNTLPITSPFEEFADIIFERLAVIEPTNSMAMRRRALLDLFKMLKDNNVESRYRKLMQEKDIYKYSHLNLDWIKKIRREPLNILVDEKTHSYYYKSIDNINTIFALPSYHTHLTGQEAEVIKGFGLNLIILMSDQLKICTEIWKSYSACKKVCKLIPREVRETISDKESKLLDLGTGKKLHNAICLIESSLIPLLKQMNKINSIYYLNKISNISEILLDIENKWASSVASRNKDAIVFYCDVAEKCISEIVNLANSVTKAAEDILSKAYSAFKEIIERDLRPLLNEISTLAKNVENEVKTLPCQNPSYFDSSSIMPILFGIDQELMTIFSQPQAENATIFSNQILSFFGNRHPSISEVIRNSLNSTPVCRLDLLTPSSLQTLHSTYSSVISSLAIIFPLSTHYFHTQAKLTYVLTSIFCNLMKNGFCIHEKQDQEQEAEENQKAIQELAGMGLGEGAGKQDVSDQIQHEEQIEGRIGEEKDDDNDEFPKDEKKDQGFEMENDFEGKVEDLGEEGKKEAEEKKEGELQREMQEELEGESKEKENKIWNEENDLNEEEEENKEAEEVKKEEVKDLTDKEMKTKMEKELKANENEELNQQEEGKSENEEANKNGSQESEEREFEEVKKEDDFHIAKDEKMITEEDKKKEDEEFPMDDNDLEEELEEENKEEPGEENGEEPQQNEADELLPGKGEEIKEEEEKKPEEKEETPDEFPLNTKQEKLGTNSNNEQSDLKAEAEQKDIGMGQSSEEQQMICNNHFDIVQVITQDYMQHKKDDEKKKEGNDVKGKLGKNTKEIKKDMMIAQQEIGKEEKDAPAKEQKDANMGQVINEEEENIKEEDQQQAIGETKMDLAPENVAFKEMEEKKEESMEEIENEPQKPETQGKREATLEKKMKEEKKKEKQKSKKDDKEIPANINEQLNEFEKENEQPEKKPSAMELAEIKLAQSKPASEEIKFKDTTKLTPEEYEKQKAEAIIKFNEWQNNDKQRTSSAMDMLQRFENLTKDLSASLCEQLRIILEPTQRTKLKGDYKTGRRLNMKKIIPFLASNYRNDKIWMRRSVPNKRDYKILLMIDDSLSMKEHNLGFFALQSVVAILQALDILEIGEVCVCAMRENLKIIHSFQSEQKYSRQKAGFILNSFTFEYAEQHSADYSLPNCLRDANHMLDILRFSTKPICIIISDGRFNKKNVKPYLVDAMDRGYTYVMIILDNYGKNSSQSILKLMTSQWKETSEGKKEIELCSHFSDFPFEYYCVLQEIEELPNTLAKLLISWFKQS